jgi:two-component system sensor histidine kinase YesM
MKLKQWPYNYSIKQKMVVVFLGISLLAVLVMAATAHHYYSLATKQDFFNIARDASKRINHQMDLYFQQLAQSTYSTIAGPLPLRGQLGKNEGAGIIQQWLEDQEVLTQNRKVLIEDTLNNYIAKNFSEITDLFLVSSDSQVISSSGFPYEGSYDYNKEPWFGTGLSKDLKVLPTYLTDYRIKGVYPVMSLIVPVFNLKTVKPMGRLVINLSLQEIQTILGQSQLGETGYFFIVSTDGTLVYHPKYEWNGLNIKDTPLQELELKEGVQMLNGKNQLVSFNHSTFTDWNVVAVVPWAEMANGLTIARNSTIIAVCVILLCIAFMVPIISNWFVRPILNLKELMQKVQLGDLSVRASYAAGRDETQMVNKSFNQMTERLEELVHTVYNLELKEVQLQLRQKEAMVQALQNQINPHLLYNTLDLIKSIAFLEQVPRIEKITTNLASVYRYSASLDQLEIQLREELIHLQKYLDIVHVRFTKNFQSHIYVNEKYEDCLIIKLSLQPIVENAVKYAVEPRNGKASIHINAYEEKECLIVEIGDNGPGIPEKKLALLNERLQSITAAGGDKLPPQESLGITNVHARLTLQYGPEYGIRLDSFPGRGTVVSVRLPFRKNGK